MLNQLVQIGAHSATLACLLPAGYLLLSFWQGVFNMAYRLLNSEGSVQQRITNATGVRVEADTGAMNGSYANTSSSASRTGKRSFLRRCCSSSILGLP